MYKQLTIPYPMTAIRILPDGTETHIRYGSYEAILIVSDNGHPITPTVQLSVATHEVTEVECLDGSIVKFDTPFYKTNKGCKHELV